MFLGALAQSIPDIDFVAAFFMDTAANLLAHRGFTHSILFAVLATFSFALLAEHFHKQHKVGYRRWVLFFAAEIAIHLLLDFYNSYGMGLLEPFSHQRFAFNALFVADPFLSLWPAIAFVALLVLRPNLRKRVFWWRFALSGVFAYLFYCTLNKIKIENEVEEILDKQNIAYQDFFTTPTPLNNWLWYVAARSDSGYYIGFRSMFDDWSRIDFHFVPQNDSLLQPVANHEEVQHLLRFSQGYYTLEKWNDTLVFNDLRFGQIIGWHDPEEKFVFHYFLQHPAGSNTMVVQRGRFAKWDAATMRSLLQRIAGN